MAEESQVTGAFGGAAQGAATGSAFGVPGAIIGGVLGGVTGFLGGGGEKKAKKLAKAQAAEIMRVAREGERRQERQAAYQVGATKAATYASNILDTGSSRQYRNAMESEYRRQIQFDMQTANTSAQTAIKGGKNAADAIKKAGWGQLLGGVTAAGTSFAAGGGFEKKVPTYDQSGPIAPPRGSGPGGPGTGLILDLKPFGKA